MAQHEPQPLDYYTSRGRKIGDFCLGFFGVHVCLAMMQMPVGFLMMAFERSDAMGSGGLGGALMAVMGVLALMAVIAAVVFFFRRGRRYIAIGIIVSASLPLLAAGACILILTALFNQGGLF